MAPPPKAQPVLIQACRTGDLGTLKELLRLGANPRAVDDMGSTMLHYAAASGSLHVAVALIQTGVNVNAKGHQGKSPLHVAAHLGQSAAAAILIANGALLNMAEPFAGRAPLHLAATCRGYDTAVALIEAGARLDARDFQGKTPLHCAAYNGSLETANLFLDRGAKVNAREEDQGPTPLDAAEEAGNMEVAQLLQRRGGKRRDQLDSTVLALKLRTALQKMSSFISRSKKDTAGKNHASQNKDAAGRPERRHTLTEIESRPATSPPLSFQPVPASTDSTPPPMQAPKVWRSQSAKIVTSTGCQAAVHGVSADFLKVEAEEWSAADRVLSTPRSGVFVRKDGSPPGRRGLSAVPSDSLKTLRHVQAIISEEERRLSCSTIDSEGKESPIGMC